MQLICPIYKSSSLTIIRVMIPKDQKCLDALVHGCKHEILCVCYYLQDVRRRSILICQSKNQTGSE